MKLEYEVIEDTYDDTTNIRSMTEQARVPGAGLLLRTTVYSPNNLATNVVFVPLADDTAVPFEALGL